ncbi:MAG: hypothetical protein WAW17_13645 [Rhodococcus sp. (in: high G+C Gram-positive bacteria)]|uniref:hypothetical protein n=1 Tax=Rhodococcus sp. TaxID=1831 RepID=UPI003BAE9E20
MSVATPGSSTGDPIFGPIDVDLAAGQTLEEPITYVVPAQAAAGAYDVYAFAGAYPTSAVEFGTVNALESGIVPPDGNPFGSSGSSGNGLSTAFLPEVR